MRHKFSQMLAVLIGVVLIFSNVNTTEVSACSNASVYAHYHNNKPALYVYSPSVDKSIQVWYNHGSRYGVERVSNSTWGILQGSPQGRSGEWTVYYISTRWRILPPPTRSHWNDDWRWTVNIC